MQFLKILFWCLLAFLAAAFTFGNWTAVPIRLPGSLVADVNLPFLLLVTFLLGLVPTFGWQAARRWRLKQRLSACERQLAEVRAVSTAPTSVAPATVAVATVPTKRSVSSDSTAKPLP